MTETTKLTSNHIVGVIDRGEEASLAAIELAQAGYTHPLVLTGEQGASQIDAKGEQGNLVKRLLASVQDHLSEATNYLRQYEEEARAGRHIVAVESPTREEAHQAQEILERHAAHNVRYFGTLAVADMTPESNPSFRSDDSPEPQADT